MPQDRQESTPLPCFRCGMCCIKFDVLLDLAEAHRIADALDIDCEYFLEKYTNHAWPIVGSFLLRRINGVCVFLKQSQDGRKTRCLVHSAKPSSCQAWSSNPSRKECREGLAIAWDITISPFGSLQGPEASIKEFRSFLESLPIDEMSFST